MLTVIGAIDSVVSILAMNREFCRCRYDSKYFGHCPLSLQKIFGHYGKWRDDDLPVRCQQVLRDSALMTDGEL